MDFRTELTSDLSDEAVELLLLGLEPLDFLVDSFVLLELLQVRPATVEVRTETERQTESERSKLVNARLQMMLRSLSMCATYMMCRIKNTRNGCRGVSPALRSCRF